MLKHLMHCKKMKKKQDTGILRKSISVIDYASIIADVTSVSTFLCTRKVGPEEVSVTESSCWLVAEVYVPLH